MTLHIGFFEATEGQYSIIKWIMLIGFFTLAMGNFFDLISRAVSSAFLILVGMGMFFFLDWLDKPSEINE